MKRIIVASALLLSCAQFAHAVDFTVGAAVNSGIATSDGSDLPYGDLVLFGTFSPGFNISANATNLAALQGAFIEVGSSYISQGPPVTFPETDPSNAGLFNGAASSIDTTETGLNIAGRQLYYWIFNASSVGAATQQGIFTSSLSSWTIPLGSPGLVTDPTFGTDISDLTIGGGGLTLDPTAEIYIGSFGTGTNGASGAADFDLATISAVPEPATTALLAGAAVLGLIALRRRRSLA